MLLKLPWTQRNLDVCGKMDGKAGLVTYTGCVCDLTCTRSGNLRAVDLRVHRGENREKTNTGPMERRVCRQKLFSERTLWDVVSNRSSDDWSECNATLKAPNLHVRTPETASLTRKELHRTYTTEVVTAWAKSVNTWGLCAERKALRTIRINEGVLCREVEAFHYMGRMWTNRIELLLLIWLCMNPQNGEVLRNSG